MVDYGIDTVIFLRDDVMLGDGERILQRKLEVKCVNCVFINYTDRCDDCCNKLWSELCGRGVDYG